MKRDECGYEQRRFRRDKRERIFIFYRNGPVPHIPKPVRAKEVQDMYQEHYYDGIEGRAFYVLDAARDEIFAIAHVRAFQY